MNSPNPTPNFFPPSSPRGGPEGAAPLGFGAWEFIGSWELGVGSSALEGDQEPIAEMNVIPFIDICLVLLIIVLVTATFSTQLLDFDHPQAAKTEFVEARAGVSVDISADGSCSMGGRKVELAALRGEIEALGGPDVIVRASRKTPSRHVIAATDQVKAAGKGRLGFELTD